MARPRTTSDEAIMLATGRAIGRHGPTGLTLAVVAEEAGLSPAGLVQRFGSKRGLLLAFARQAAEAVIHHFDRARQNHAGPLAALRDALLGLGSGVQSPRELANHLGFLHLDLTDEEFRESALAQARLVRKEITRLLRDAVVEQELAGGVNVTKLARLVQVTYNGSLIVWALGGEGALAAALRADLDQVLRPYQTQKRRKP